MTSRISQVLLVIGALICFLPVVAVDYFLDNYVRGRETQRLRTQVQAITDETQKSAYQGVVAIRTILANSPSLCTPTFIANVRQQLQADYQLKQVVVENLNGVQYCDGYDQVVTYSVLSDALAIPGADETLSVVKFEDDKLPSLRITEAVGHDRFISAFVGISPHVLDGIPKEFGFITGLRMRLTDGADLLVLGESMPQSEDSKYIVAHGLADALPLLTEAVVPFDVVRADYADLGIGLTVITAIMSAAFLVLAVQYVRRTRLQGLDLEFAMNHGELKPYYQPVMDLSSGRVSGCEVLIRWQKRSGEIVSPNVFIDFAETSGLALPMTIQLMQQVRGDLSGLCKDMPELKVAINLFEGHFRDTTIVDDVQAIFEGSDIAYTQLVFEITERRPLEDQLASTAVIGGLQALGCRLAIDDAGTGHSNLQYIQTLGVDIIKIDRIFVSMVDADTTQLPVLDGLITMALGMGAEVVAEGVETEAQALYLREKGVMQAQGFLFAPALEKGEFIKLTRALNSVGPDIDDQAQSARKSEEDGDDSIADRSAVA